MGEPHTIKSETTKLGKHCESKARFLLEWVGYDCIDVGEGFEFDFISTGRGTSKRIQVKAIGLDGRTTIGRTSQKTSGAVHKKYGADAFDYLFLIDRDSLSGYCIPVEEILHGDKVKSSVRAADHPTHFITASFPHNQLNETTNTAD